MDDFETFTRDKIAKLRAEADAMERFLKEYQVTKARASGSVRRSSEAQVGAGGAFGAILSVLRGKGAKGMSLDEMIHSAEVMGFDVKRNTLRSQLFTAKGKGQVEAMDTPGHYRAPPSQWVSDVQQDYADVHFGRDGTKEVLVGPPETSNADEFSFNVGPARTGPKESFELDDDPPF